MKQILLFVFLFAATSSSQAQLVNWLNDIGNSTASNVSETGYSVAVDDDGKVYVVGAFYGTNVEFNPRDNINNPQTLSSTGDADIFVAKYTSAGLCEWAFSVGQTGTDVGLDIAVGSGSNPDIYVVGTFADNSNATDFDPIGGGSFSRTAAGTLDGFLAKYNTNGEAQFVNTFGFSSSINIPSGVALHGSDVFITGTFIGGTVLDGSTLLASSGSSFDAYFAKYNSSGTHQWSYQIGNTDDDRGVDIAVDANRVYITGAFSGTVDFDPGLGTVNLTSNGSTHKDVFVAAYTDGGTSATLVWAVQAGGTEADDMTVEAIGESGLGIASDGTNVYVTGNIRGTAAINFGGSNTVTPSGGDDAFIASYLGSTGANNWAVAIGGSSTDFGNTIAVSGSSVYVAGQYQGTANFNPNGTALNKMSVENDDIYVVKYPTSGTHGSIETEGIIITEQSGPSTNNEDAALGIAINGSGEPIVTGYFEHLIDFDNSSSTSSGATDNNQDRDIFIVSYKTIAFPVEFTYFKGQATESGNVLTWETASEKDNAGFEVQRSLDGRNWEVLGFEAGAGYSILPIQYNFTDAQPAEGINYYRLKQTDFDGAFEYSNVISINNSGAAAPLTLMPNPVNDVLNINNGQGLASIYNALGQKVAEFNINDAQATYNVNQLPKGQYIISIQRANGALTTQRFLVD